jgi:O-antigen ligase
MIALLIIALVAVTLFAVANPFVGTIGLLGVIFIRPGEIYPSLGPLHIERVLSVVVMAAFLFHGNRLRFSKVTKALLIFWVTMFCSVPLSFWPGGALQASIDFGKAVIYYLLIANLATTSRRLRATLITFCVMVGWLAGQALVEYIKGVSHYAMGIDRAIGLNSLSNDPNALGITLVTALPLIALFGYRGAGSIRWLAWGLIAVCVWTTILTGSRASYITFAVLAFLYALTSKRRVASVLIVLTLVAGLWFAMPEQYKSRLETVSDLSDDASYQGRLMAWKAGWEAFKENPLTGVGTTMFLDSRGAKTGHWLNVHSLYIQVLAELGLLGALAFAGFLFSVFSQNLRMSREFADSADLPVWLAQFPRACSLSLVALLFAGYSGHLLYRETWYLLAAFSTAALVVMKGSEFARHDAPALISEPAERYQMGRTGDYAWSSKSF